MAADDICLVEIRCAVVVTVTRYLQVGTAEGFLVGFAVLPCDATVPWQLEHSFNLDRGHGAGKWRRSGIRIVVFTSSTVLSDERPHVDFTLVGLPQVERGGVLESRWSVREGVS